MSKQEQQMALDLGDEIEVAVLKARKVYEEHSNYSGTSFHITKNHMTKKYWYAMRTFNYDTEWDFFFTLGSIKEARAIVDLGYATWHWSLKEEEK